MSTKRQTSAAQAIDGLALALFIPILAITIPALAFFSIVAATLIIVAPVCIYVWTQILEPLRKSHPIERGDMNLLIGDPKVRFRESEVLSTRALDIGFRKYVIFNAQDLNGFYQDWRGLLGHEYAHLKNGDARYFHYASVFGFITMLSMAFTVLPLLLYFVMPQTAKVGNPSETALVAVLLPLGGVAVSAFFLLWIRRSLHLREYRADLAGMNLHADAFADWMRRAVRREKRQQNARKLSFSQLSGWVTHPAFESRSQMIASPELTNRVRLVGELFRSLGFLYGGAFLTYGVFLTPEGYIDPDTSLPIWAIGIFFLLLILPLSAGCGAMSVSAMSSLDAGGWKAAFTYCILLALFHWFILSSFYFAIDGLGVSESLTSDLPAVPQENMTSGTWEFLAIFLNFAVSLFALCVLAAKILGRFRYNPIIHIMIGGLSFVGGFQLTRLQNLLVL